jgi:hypothetical protein
MPSEANEESYGHLLGETAGSLGKLVSDELALARAEMRDSVHLLGRDLVRGAVAFSLAACSLVPLALFLTFLIGGWVGSVTWGALITFGVYLILGGLLAGSLRSRIGKDLPTFPRARHSLEEEKAALAKIANIREAGKRRSS